METRIQRLEAAIREALAYLKHPSGRVVARLMLTRVLAESPDYAPELDADISEGEAMRAGVSR
jgi:hypothetical protein